MIKFMFKFYTIETEPKLYTQFLINQKGKEKFRDASKAQPEEHLA